VLWGVGVTSAGYFLGKAIPGAEHYLLPIVIGIVIISVIPALIHYIQEKLAAKS
jgi:membrane-associated protein